MSDAQTAFDKAFAPTHEEKVNRVLRDALVDARDNGGDPEAILNRAIRASRDEDELLGYLDTARSVLDPDEIRRDEGIKRAQAKAQARTLPTDFASSSQGKQNPAMAGFSGYDDEGNPLEADDGDWTD